MKTEKIKVIIAEDHDLYRDGLRNELNRDSEIEVIAEATNGMELIQLVKKYKPDVVLTDLSMPVVNGFKAIHEIFKTGMLRIIAFSGNINGYVITDALAAGALGFIAKDAGRGEAIEAVKCTYQFKSYYCQSVLVSLARLNARHQINPQVKRHIELFSEKEKQIIRLVCEEKSSKEIATELFMSKRTIEGLRSKILVKMNVKTPAGLAVYAIENSIYHINPAAKPD